MYDVAMHHFQVFTYYLLHYFHIQCDNKGF